MTCELDSLKGLVTARVQYISRKIYKELPREFRERLLKHLYKPEIVGKYVANVESYLHARGEHDLANELVGHVARLVKDVESS